MHMPISLAEGAALHGLIEETTGDIVVRLDRNGFIETASENIGRLGYDLSQLLLKPHLADLTDRHHSNELHDHIASVLSGRTVESGAAEWIEFPTTHPVAADCDAGASEWLWYGLSLRAISDESGDVIGALGLLRSLERRRALEGEVRANSHVEPITGLANRNACCAMLRQQLASGHACTLAMFEVDRMRAVFMQYGQRTADEVLWGFARFLETMVHDSFQLAVFEGQKICVLLPGVSCRNARKWVQEVLQTLSSLTLTSPSRAPQLTASAGLTPVEASVDWTLRQAELALVMAKARGGMQVAETLQCGSPIKNSMP